MMPLSPMMMGGLERVGCPRIHPGVILFLFLFLFSFSFLFFSFVNS